MPSPLTITTPTLSLTLDLTVTDPDLSVPENATLTVSVQAGTFSATAPMDIDASSLPDFCNDLKKIYDTLSGNAKISEPYGKRYLSFCGDGKGHVEVSGYLYNRADDGFYGEMSFETLTDQTVLPTLIRGLSELASGL